MKERIKTLLDYTYFTIKWKKFFIKNIAIITIFMICLSLMLPRWFTAKTTILPPVSDSGQMGVSSFLNNIPLSGIGMGVIPESEESTIFLAILNSRTVMDSIAIKFNLQKRYHCKDLEKTVKILRKRVETKIDEEGTITLKIKTKTPFLLSKSNDNEARELAKNIANEFIIQLDIINRRLKTERGHNIRIFLENRYNQTLNDLYTAENNYKNYQEKYGTISLPEQTTATINAAADLKAEIIAKEVEMDILNKTVGPSHSEYIRTKRELAGLQKKYSDFISGENGTNKKSTSAKDVFLPLTNIPNLGVEYARLYRDMVLQEKLLEFLLPEYEQAKIKEAKNTPTVQVLDEAVRPIKKSSPKRLLLVISAGLLSFVCCFFYIVGLENLQEMKNKNTSNYQKIQKIYALIKKNKNN